MPTVLITGASRGIGRELARMLVSQGWQVLAGVRDPMAAPPGTRGERLDMADSGSINALAQRLRASEQRLDALVNNAGIYDGPARRIWDVNVLGPLLLTRALEPLLAPGSRVVMVTSGLGRLSSQPQELVKRLSAPNLSLDDIESLAHEAPGGYGASKAALSAMARIFANRMNDRGILVNAISPGWVRTDMGGAGAPRSVQQGAASLLWGVQLPSDGPSGGVFEDGKPIE
ncbi:MAG: SDR family NAD(P)-dependent oxidoreductase [Betaproteobacteria bacterium]|nr:SDR family NAD(P)-dependent oxidoreductase [Betaproteobacteria bacterium]